MTSFDERNHKFDKGKRNSCKMTKKTQKVRGVFVVLCELFANLICNFILFEFLSSRRLCNVKN